MNIRILRSNKLQDDMINVKSLEPHEIDILKKHPILSKYNYISYNPVTKRKEVIEALKYNKVPISKEELKEAFNSQPEEGFKYLSKINDPVRLYAEINRKQGDPRNKGYLKLGLGIRRFEFHHVAYLENDEAAMLPKIDNVDVVFFYYSLEQLIKDIRDRL